MTDNERLKRIEKKLNTILQNGGMIGRTAPPENCSALFVYLDNRLDAVKLRQLSRKALPYFVAA